MEISRRVIKFAMKTSWKLRRDFPGGDYTEIVFFKRFIKSTCNFSEVFGKNCHPYWETTKKNKSQLAEDSRTKNQKEYIFEDRYLHEQYVRGIFKKFIRILHFQQV